ncbi:MAG TPA: insulinase family protein [Candidatus Kapabacteria bacterium]|nr:insulinase family protein [Candidatus Kapabacteria bacterium]
MKKFLSLAIVALMCFSAINSNAQVDRSKKPEPGPLPKSAVPPFQEITLKNGLRIVIVEDHTQPLVYFRTLVLSGNAQDAGSIGAAEAVTDLLEKGTTTMNADDIAKKLDFFGASLGASSTVDDINVSIGCLKRDMDKVLPIYADVIKNPIFPATELEKYKSEQISALQAARQRPGELGRKMGRKMTYDVHPYGNIATDSTVKALTVEVLKTWHGQHFCAKNSIIAVVGDITESEIKPVLEKQFGSWKSGMLYQPMYPVVEPKQGLTISLVDRPGSKQSTVRLQHLGVAVTSPDFDRASLVMSIFAGNGVIGFANRLFQNIREKHGYTYTPGGSLTKSVDRGVMVAVAEVRNSVTDSALDQMLLEYRRLSTEAISDNELNFAKGLIAGKFMMDLADRQNTAGLVLSTLEYGLPKDYYSTYPERVSKFTSAELQDVAKRVFPPNDISVIVVGDASQILPMLQKFGKVNVYDLDLKPKKDVAVHISPTTSVVADVINKMYAGLNRSEYEKVKNRKVEGTVTLELGGGPQTLPFEEITAAPNKKYQKLDLGAPMIIEMRIDGTNVYEYQGMRGGPADPTTAHHELGQSAFDEELHVTDQGYNVTLEGVTLVPAGAAYILDVMKPGGYHEKWYVDTTSGYITRKDLIEKEGTETQDYSDFRVVDGTPYPFKVEIHGAGDQTVEIKSIKNNTSIDDTLFMKKPDSKN